MLAADGRLDARTAEEERDRGFAVKRADAVG